MQKYEVEKNYKILVSIDFKINELGYTNISQTDKMTLTDRVSNNGGVIGVFLDCLQDL